MHFLLNFTYFKLFVLLLLIQLSKSQTYVKDIISTLNCGNVSRPICHFLGEIDKIVCVNSDIVEYNWKAFSKIKLIHCRFDKQMEIDVVYRNQNRNVLSNFRTIQFRKLALDIGNKSTYEYHSQIPFGSTYAGETLIKYYIVREAGKKNANEIILLPSFKTSSWLSELDREAKSNETLLIDREIINLPCKALGSEFPEGVYKIGNEIENQTSTYIPRDGKSLHWDFVRGYRLNISTKSIEDFEGKYFCKSKTGLRGLPFLTSKYFELIPPPEFIVEPNSEKINLPTFSTSTLTLKCNSKSPMEFKGYENFNGSAVEVEFYEIFQAGRFMLTLKLVNLSIGSGNITCSSKNSSNFTHNWEISVYDLNWGRVTGLAVDRDGTEAICTGNFNSQTSKFKNVACNSPFECESLSKCLKDDYFCNNLVKVGQPCDYLYCAQLAPFPNGILQCEDQQPVIYFTGFDQKLYNHWKDALLNQTLLMYSTEREFYTKGTFTFTCQFHKFLSSGPVHWIVGFKNRSSIQLQEKNLNLFNDVTLPEYPQIAEYSIDLYLESVNIDKIECVVPEWDTEDWARVEYPLIVRESTVPQVTLRSSNPEFIIGQSHQALRCLFSGHPMPDVTFNTADMSFEELISRNFSVKEEEYSVLLFFPNFTKTMEDTYFCRAKNVAGETVKQFKVLTTVKRNNLLAWIIRIVVPAVTIISLIFCAYCKTKEKLRKTEKALAQITDKDVEGFFNGIPNNCETVNSDVAADSMPFDTTFSISRDDLDIDFNCVLGSGAFGIVFKGKFEDRYVAVKSTKSDCTAQQMKSALSELKLLIYIEQHHNIVELIGAVVSEIRQGNLYIVTELCELGSLEKYLRAIRKQMNLEEPNSEYNNFIKGNQRYENDFPIFWTLQVNKPSDFECRRDFLKWCWQISNAMEFLGTKKVVHADLATRNVLLTKDKTAKLTDFGLSRKLYNYVQYTKKKQEPLPWRWMSIESLQLLEFTSKSDIWSFSVMIWEIYSFGCVPYPGIPYDETFLIKLQNGLRLEKPEFVTEEIFDKMSKCWNRNPLQRPLFSELKTFFKQKYWEDTDYPVILSE